MDTATTDNDDPFLRLQKNTYEIEKKWILNDRPAGLLGKPEVKEYRVEQFYVSFAPEVRLRKMMNTWNNPLFYRESIKVPTSDMLVRREFEHDIPADTYYGLRDLCARPECIIRKRYYTLPVPGNTSLIYEISEVDESWWYVEVEFNTKQEADTFVLDREFIDLGARLSSISMVKYAERKSNDTLSKNLFH